MRRTAAIIAGSALLALAGCSSSAGPKGTPTSSAASIGADTIVIRDFAFDPSQLTVSPGAKITVINKDGTTHTLTATTNPKAFDTGDIAAGASASFTAPSKAGTYSYICEIHQYMHGELVVR